MVFYREDVATTASVQSFIDNSPDRYTERIPIRPVTEDAEMIIDYNASITAFWVIYI